MFESITTAPSDPILGLTSLFRNDSRPQKINLGIGVYKNESGQIPILDSVKKTEIYLLDHEKTKNYLDIAGIPSFATATQQLLLGENSPILHHHRARTAQSVGGTGALRIAADFLAKNTQANKVWISNPTWPNHYNIFHAAGFTLQSYDYYDADTNLLDIPKLLASLSSAKANDVIVFHGCCHNPTGIDPDLAQWQQLATFCKEKRLLPLFDIAYQGFANGLHEDTQGIRLFAEQLDELIICNSYSKNFSLYNERVGAITLIAADQESADRALSQIKQTIRANYSNPPAHGANIVTTILTNPTLRSLWEQEIIDMRSRLKRMRQLLVTTLQDKGTQQDYSFISQQNGMFSFSGLNKEQVQRLRDEYAIYIVDSGRINIAGINLTNLSTICEAMVAVEK